MKLNRILKLKLMLYAAAVLDLTIGKAQNLVPNAGFEAIDTCSQSFGLGGLMNWNSANWTPDHFHGCGSYGAVNGLPLNYFTFQQPYEGDGCAGLHSYDGLEGWREWIMVPLLENLQAGVTYYCSFWANAGFGAPTVWVTNNNIGMLFTVEDRSWSLDDPIPETPNTAHVYDPQILVDTVAWTLVSGSFVADSAYQFLMIGNFFNNELTDTIHFAPPGSVPTWYPWSYTLIDAVCVSPHPQGCDLPQSITDRSKEDLKIWPNPSSGILNIEFMGASGDLIVLDLMGRAVYRQRVSSGNIGLDLSDLTTGNYIIQIDSPERSYHSRFVKN